MAANCEALCTRYSALESDRKTFISHWQEIARYIFPRRDDFDTERTPGDKRQQYIVDSTGTQALELLAAGLHGQATNPAALWFALKRTMQSLDDSSRIKEYMAAVEKVMFAEMHAPGAAITTHLHELYLDYAAFGTGVMFIGQSKNNRLLFQTRFLGECVIDENAEGVVDTVFRCFKVTVRNAIQMFGQEKVSEDTRKKFVDGKLNDKVTIIHAVYPREDADPVKTDKENMPFASVYLEKHKKHLLKEGGFEEFPYAVPRWYKVAGEVYGRSPGMTALPDVKMLQEMMKTTIKGAQKIVDPPLMVPDEGMIGPVRTVPGGLNYLRGDSNTYGIRPLQTGGNVPLALDMLQDLRNRIMQTFFVDQLQMTGDADMTATEVIQRTEERMRLLGPILGRMEAELLGPVITRVFGLLFRMGKLPEQPEELDGEEFTVEYVSPIALAQRGQKVQRVVAALQVAGQLAASADSGSPTFARVDSDKVLPWVFDQMNADPALLLDDQEMAAKQQNNAMANAAAPAALAAEAFQKAGAGAKSFAEAGQLQ